MAPNAGLRRACNYLIQPDGELASQGRNPGNGVGRSKVTTLWGFFKVLVRMADRWGLQMKILSHCRQQTESVYNTCRFSEVGEQSCCFPTS